MSDSFLSASILLLLLFDPFGNAPVMTVLLKDVPPARRRFVILRECVAAWIALLVFMYAGETVMRVLQLSETSLGIAGGVLLFLIALRMIFPQPDGVFGEWSGGEPFIVPLAIPLIAGPSAMAMVMLLVSREPERFYTWMGAMSAAMAVTTLVLLAAGPLMRRLGERGTTALERLMGLLLCAVAIEMLLAGVRRFAESL
ncbi:MAG: MarC family protein [Gammaproteobacteria bacterium]|jgi:MarC family membrane protein|nr:MarC family protein [Gammaproteobacteria bacterium]MBU0773268.1 MarC family protein [Gammaproteobacteria bacterium]MBU0857821.1 MarC family protein [Gammaproteobacteria bacterium]MBU1846025.1 MarC family protein [Gammaproteobacteria bacterium]